MFKRLSGKCNNRGKTKGRREEKSCETRLQREELT